MADELPSGNNNLDQSSSGVRPKQSCITTTTKRCACGWFGEGWLTKIITIKTLKLFTTHLFQVPVIAFQITQICCKNL